MTELLADAAAERLAGTRPSRAHALAAAVIAGLVVTVTTYKLLRAG